MKLRLRRFHFAVAIGLLAIVSAAALVSSGRAGSGSATFTGVALPPTVSLGGQGSVRGEVTSSSGITHGVLTITLPGDFQNVNCLGGTPSGNVCSYDFGLATGKTYTAFATYQAVDGLTTLGDHPVDFSLDWDNGKGGKGAMNHASATAHVNIVTANGTSDAAGTCSTASQDSVYTLLDVNNTNKQSTRVNFGPAAASPLGYFFPCTGVYAQELSPRSAGRSEVSIFSGPTFQSLATLIVSFYGYTHPLSLTLYPNAPANYENGTPVQSCPSPTTMADGQKVCLVGWQKVGNTEIATLLYAGGDPGLDGI